MSVAPPLFFPIPIFLLTIMIQKCWTIAPRAVRAETVSYCLAFEFVLLIESQ